MRCVDEQHFEAARLEDLVDGDPVDSGRLHHDGVDPTFLEPGGQCVEVARERAERSDVRVTPILRDSYPMLAGADVEACRVRMTDFQPLDLALSLPHRSHSRGCN